MRNIDRIYGYGANILKQTVREFIDDDCPRMAAALAYYTIFSLPPLLLIIITLTGLFLDPETVQTWIRSQVGGLIGRSGAEQIQAVVDNARSSVQGGVSLGLSLSIAGLLIGATGAFAQMQKALNTAWEVAPDPERGGLTGMLMKRVLSLGMIVVVAFLLLVSLILSSLISSFAGRLGELLPGGVSSVLVWTIDGAVSLLVITWLFAAIFRYLPDARIAWNDVWVGAAVTAALFVIGKFLIGLYIGQSNPGEAYGAAAALAIILIWVYYSSMILFLGAEFTQIWTRRHSGGILPAEGAIKVVAHHDGPGDRAAEESRR